MGRTRAAAIELDARRPARRKERARRQVRAPRFDSFGWDDEGDEAELPAVLARAGVAGVDGGVLGSHGGGGGQQGSN